MRPLVSIWVVSLTVLGSHYFFETLLDKLLGIGGSYLCMWGGAGHAQED